MPAVGLSAGVLPEGEPVVPAAAVVPPEPWSRLEPWCRRRHWRLRRWPGCPFPVPPCPAEGLGPIPVGGRLFGLGLQLDQVGDVAIQRGLGLKPLGVVDRRIM